MNTLRCLCIYLCLNFFHQSLFSAYTYASNFVSFIYTYLFAWSYNKCAFKSILVSNRFLLTNRNAVHLHEATLLNSLIVSRSFSLFCRWQEILYLGNCYSPPREVEWPPYPKCDVNVKTDAATHAPREHENIHYFHSEAPCGRQDLLPGTSKNALSSEKRLPRLWWWW